MANKTDYVVSDISLADFGRKEIGMAEIEMPGLMAIHENPRPASRQGRLHRRLLHMTIQTLLIETLVALGAEVLGCNIFRPRTMPRPPSPPPASRSSPGRARA